MMMRGRLLGLTLAAGLTASAAARADVVVGVMGPMTGPNATFGAQIRNGAEQAAEDLNEAGGINGQKIKLIVEDDASEPSQGISVANKFVGDGVKFVVGAFNSGVTMPASEVLVENNILEITPGSTNPSVTERGFWNVFRTCGRDDQQGAVAAKYILEKFAGKKVAILHDKTPYGKGLADETKKALNAGGITEVMYEGLNIGDKDFSATVSKIKATGAALVYWGGVHTEGGLLVRQMKDQGVGAVLMGGDGIATDEFAQVAGPGVEGTLMTFAPDPQKRPEAQPVLAKFEKRKFKPETYTLYAYAALQVIAQGAAASKSIDPKQVAAEIHKGAPFKTVIGELSYDKKGDITRPDYVIYKWVKGADGKFAYVQQ